MISGLDTQTLAVDASIALQQSPAGRFPVSAAIDTTSGVIWVANSEDSVTRIDLFNST